MSGSKSQPEASAPQSPCPSQPEASARNAFAATDDLIDHNECLNEELDKTLAQQEKPIQKIRGFNPYTKLNGYKTLDPQEPIAKCQDTGTNTQPPSPPPDPRPSLNEITVIRGSGPEPKNSFELASIRGSKSDPYIELPPDSEISHQPPEVQEFLASLKQEPNYTNTS